ncbi:DUF4233 domain-containing protein [Lacisediminihabitans changchengi]|uniref:DUF4233 domain-containing protein n=1 Tax=Lacisediminihabitans changchengi TaxID=2787634 RepID=A0A934W148_9MICO|nr:DUF4233 domain-containing protein [Lacisediminihabitans changchengi]MBK4346503.1 DUF4233 domain-containing protein [Lacisediminihabitans changchengi]
MTDGPVADEPAFDEPAAPAPRLRRRRSATESLLSITLLLEAILVFFIVMVVFGLRVLPPAVAFGGGAALVVVLLLVGRLVRYRWGVWIGWVVQAFLISLGLLLPVMYFVGAIFTGIWIYCVITGRRLDRRNAAFSEPTETS